MNFKLFDDRSMKQTVSLSRGAYLGFYQRQSRKQEKGETKARRMMLESVSCLVDSMPVGQFSRFWSSARCFYAASRIGRGCVTRNESWKGSFHTIIYVHTCILRVYSSYTVASPCDEGNFEGSDTLKPFNSRTKNLRWLSGSSFSFHRNRCDLFVLFLFSFLFVRNLVSFSHLTDFTSVGSKICK